MVDSFNSHSVILTTFSRDPYVGHFYPQLDTEDWKWKMCYSVSWMFILFYKDKVELNLISQVEKKTTLNTAIKHWSLFNDSLSPNKYSWLCIFLKLPLDKNILSVLRRKLLSVLKLAHQGVFSSLNLFNNCALNAYDHWLMSQILSSLNPSPVCYMNDALNFSYMFIGINYIFVTLQ